MYPLQITVGASSSLFPAVLPALVAALAALGGVWLSNGAAERRHRREVEAQRTVRLAEAEAAQAALARDRGLAALALAEHLEEFVLECADVVASVRSVVWSDPYTVAEWSNESPRYLKRFGPWPDLVDWKLLGLASATRAAAFRRKAELEEKRLSGYSENMSGEDTHEEAGSIAAELGLEAWSLAEEARRENQIAPFQWHNDWSAVEQLKEHRDRISARRAAEKASLSDLEEGAALGETRDGS